MVIRRAFRALKEYRMNKSSKGKGIMKPLSYSWTMYLLGDLPSYSDVMRPCRSKLGTPVEVQNYIRLYTVSMDGLLGAIE